MKVGTKVIVLDDLRFGEIVGKDSDGTLTGTTYSVCLLSPGKDGEYDKIPGVIDVCPTEVIPWEG